MYDPSEWFGAYSLRHTRIVPSMSNKVVIVDADPRRVFLSIQSETSGATLYVGTDPTMTSIGQFSLTTAPNRLEISYHTHFGLVQQRWFCGQTTALALRVLEVLYDPDVY